MNKMFVAIPGALLLAGIIALTSFNVIGKASVSDGSCGGSCTKTNSCGLAGCGVADTGKCGCQKTTCSCGCDGTCDGTCNIEGCNCSKGE